MSIGGKLNYNKKEQSQKKRYPLAPKQINDTVAWWSQKHSARNANLHKNLMMDSFSKQEKRSGNGITESSLDLDGELSRGSPVSRIENDRHRGASDHEVQPKLMMFVREEEDQENNPILINSGRSRKEDRYSGMTQPQSQSRTHRSSSQQRFDMRSKQLRNQNNYMEGYAKMYKVVNGREGRVMGSKLKQAFRLWNRKVGFEPSRPFAMKSAS